MSQSAWNLTGALLTSALAVGCGGTVDGGPDPGADGSSISLPTGERCDDLCDGTEDTCFAYSYDAAGNVTLRKVDEGCDVTLDECDHLTYDSQDRPTGGTQDACDGDPYYCDQVSYGPDNHGVGRGDSKCDGTPNDCYTVVSDDTGAIVSATTEVACTGEPQTCVSFEYDDAGRALKDRFDYGCDGAPDECFDYVYEFDAQNRATRKTQTTCDGSLVSCCTYTYD